MSTNQEVYILRTFKAINDDVRVQREALKHVDKILNDIQRKIGLGAAFIAHGANMKTVTLAHIHGAASTVLADANPQFFETVFENAKGSLDQYENKQSKSRSERAGIFLSISRVKQNLKNSYSGFKRIQEQAVVFLACVLDFLCTEICSLAVHAAQSRGAKTVQHLDVYQGILSNPALNSIIIFHVNGSSFAAETIAKMHTCTGKNVKVVCDKKGLK